MKYRRFRRLLCAVAALALLGVLTLGARSPAPTGHGNSEGRLSQARLISGSTELTLRLMGATGKDAAVLSRLNSKVLDPDVNAEALVTPHITAGGPVAGSGIAGGPGNVVPGRNGSCPVHLDGNIKVNQDCENASDPAFHGRGQAQNETAIAANPLNPHELIAGQNDYRFGDGSCGADFSLDGGQTWGSSLVPTKFVIDPKTHQREYWQGSGDPAVAWDSSGTAYMECMSFNRGAPPTGPTNNPDTNSGIYVFRSDNKGASFDFPGSRGGAAGSANGQVTYQVGSPATGLPLADKPYLAIDANPESRFRDYIYIAWTLFDKDHTAKIFVNRSRDHGETWDGNVLVSTPSNLCLMSVAGRGNCDANQFSDPVVAPNGDLYVAWNNFNNAVSEKDNRNQILLAKSTDGGQTFGQVTKVSDYYDLPSCALYTGGQSPGRACVPVKAPADVASQPSVFRATNYPTLVVDPHNSDKVTAYFGSYINRNSNESNGCTPAGIAPDGNNAFTGVNTPDACNNEILVSASTDGGTTWTGKSTDPRLLPSLSRDGDRTDQFWQWAAVLENGTPVVSFYDRKYGSDETTGFSDISVWVGGHTSRATSSSNPPPTQFPNSAGHGVFMGDYSGLTVAGETAIPFWSDTRDVGITSCPTNVRQLCSFGNDQDVFIARVEGANEHRD